MIKKLGILIFFILAILFALPILSTVVLSFRTAEGFHYNGYMDLFFDCFIFYPMFWHSVLYGAAILFLQLLVIVPFGFGFMNAKFRGKEGVFIFYILLMMMPLQVTILPNYIGLREMGLLDTRRGMIFPMVFSPFSLVVLIQYMKGLDESYIEAARLETSSIIKILKKLILPQIKVCLSAAAVFIFVEAFSMLEQPLLYLKRKEIQTLSVLIAESFKYEGDLLFPAAVIFMLPVLILYLFFKDSLDKGLVFGELK